VYWSESGELVTLACEDSFYVLRFSRENYVAAVQAGEVEDDGVESAFEVITDINERYVLFLDFLLIMLIKPVYEPESGLGIVSSILTMPIV